MGHSVIEMTRAVRRRVERVVRKSREKDYARRAVAVVHLWETQGDVADVAHRVRGARSSVYRWQSLYETYGEDGLRPQARGRSDWKASDEVLSMLESIMKEDPRELGYLRSRWSSQLLAIELANRSGVEVHATTVRRWLVRLRYRYRRARPTLCRRDPRKAERLGAIEAALAENDPYTEVFYVDEADVDLNKPSARVELDALRGANRGPDSGTESEALRRGCSTCAHRPIGLGRTSPKDLGSVCEAARAASSPVSTG